MERMQTEPYEIWEGLDRNSEEYKKLKEERSQVRCLPHSALNLTDSTPYLLQQNSKQCLVHVHVPVPPVVSAVTMHASVSIDTIILS
jgi:hypothetical protein